MPPVASSNCSCPCRINKNNQYHVTILFDCIIDSKEWRYLPVDFKGQESSYTLLVRPPNVSHRVFAYLLLLGSHLFYKPCNYGYFVQAL